jgi:hypothetical protein
MSGVREAQISGFGSELAQKGGGEFELVFVPEEGFIQVANQHRLIQQFDVLPQGARQTNRRGAYLLAMA